MMICAGTNIDCDNPGCRRGGCQGRLPELPLFLAATRALKPEPQPAPALATVREPRAKTPAQLAA